MADAAVKIAGLTELRRTLKRAGDLDQLERLGAAIGEAGAIVVAAARAKAAATGRPADAALANTYRVTRARSKAVIKIGDGKPYRLGNEFGSRYRERNTRHGSVLGWRQFPEAVKGGRFVYPAAGDKGAEIAELIGTAIDRELQVG